ncbi:MAG: hypothetical protein H6624_15300 [Bdellovibrionaceae bacterium]|nr:hypothetical protein [Bdellovibrionales bacterium]MCB9085712.1 hypothetical protein [Pseudobdellovibrionaceae bacterium]
MKTSRRSTIVCITILSFLIAQQAFAIRLLSPQERKGELRGHLDKNPPIPIYGPDSIILSYVDKGRIETVTDQSGALTLAVSVDAVESVLKSGRSEIVKTKYQGNQPQTIEKSLEMLKVKFGKGSAHPKAEEIQARIEKASLVLEQKGALSGEFVQSSREVLDLVGYEEEYQEGKASPQGAVPFYSKIRGQGFESKPELFIYDLQPAQGTSRPSGNQQSTSQ